jgi:hypothetical protein
MHLLVPGRSTLRLPFPAGDKVDGKFVRERVIFIVKIPDHELSRDRIAGSAGEDDHFLFSGTPAGTGNIPIKNTILRI